MFIKRKAGVYLLIPVMLLLFIGLSAEDTAEQTLSLRVSEICIVSVSGSPSELLITSAGSGGESPLQASDNQSYIQYSSTVSSDTIRSITVRWADNDAAPSGCILKLTAFPGNESYEGHSTGETVLSSSPQPLLSNIGSCATGTGPGEGARLNYTLRVVDSSLLKAGEQRNVNITFTLTDVS